MSILVSSLQTKNSHAGILRGSSNIDLVSYFEVKYKVFLFSFLLRTSIIIETNFLPDLTYNTRLHKANIKVEKVVGYFKLSVYDGYRKNQLGK